MKCKDILNEKMKDRQQLLNQFSDILEEDVKRVFQKVEDIRTEIVKPWLLDENSDPVEVNDTLENLMDKLLSCKSTSEEYQSYQTELKVCCFQ